VRVKDESRTWEEGKCMVFDASFEHEAWNRGDFTVFILVITTYHPDLTDIESRSSNKSTWTSQQKLTLRTLSRSKRGKKQLEGTKWWI